MEEENKSGWSSLFTGSEGMKMTHAISQKSIMQLVGGVLLAGAGIALFSVIMKKIFNV